MTDNLANQSRRDIIRAKSEQVYFDIDTLLRATTWLWPGKATTPASIARTTGLRPNTVLDMASNRALHVTLLHFGLVAWYFGAGTDLVLRYRPAEDDVSIPELERDLALIDQGLPPADPPSELPRLRRQQAPAGPPGPGAIEVINRVPLLLGSVNQGEFAEMTGRFRTNIARYTRAPVSRIARSTIAELLEAFRLDHMSAILDVRLKLDCYSDTGESAPDAVRIETLMPIWNSVDWPQLVERWRALADAQQKPEPLADVDVAAIRYIYAVIAANQGGRAPRLGGQLANALGVSRETISNVVSGDFWRQITALDLPISVQQLIHQTLQLPPLEQEQDAPATEAEGVGSR